MGAIRNKNGRLGWAIGLIPVWIGLMVGVLIAGRNISGNTRGLEGLLIAALIAFGLVFLAFVLRAAGFAFIKHGWSAVMMFVLAGALILCLSATGGRHQHGWGDGSATRIYDGSRRDAPYGNAGSHAHHVCRLGLWINPLKIVGASK